MPQPSITVSGVSGVAVVSLTAMVGRRIGEGGAAEAAAAGSGQRWEEADEDAESVGRAANRVQTARSPINDLLPACHEVACRPFKSSQWSDRRPDGHMVTDIHRIHRIGQDRIGIGYLASTAQTGVACPGLLFSMSVCHRTRPLRPSLSYEERQQEDGDGGSACS